MSVPEDHHFIFNCWGERSKPHPCGVNGKLSVYVYIYVWYVRIPYIYILPHLCAMQYFHIACWFTVARDKTSKTERLNGGMQQGLENGEEKGAQLARRRFIINVLRDTAANGECSVY